MARGLGGNGRKPKSRLLPLASHLVPANQHVDLHKNALIWCADFLSYCSGRRFL